MKTKLLCLLLTSPAFALTIAPPVQTVTRTETGVEIALAFGFALQNGTLADSYQWNVSGEWGSLAGALSPLPYNGAGPLLLNYQTTWRPSFEGAALVNFPAMLQAWQAPYTSGTLVFEWPPANFGGYFPGTDASGQRWQVSAGGTSQIDFAAQTLAIHYAATRVSDEPATLLFASVPDAGSAALLLVLGCLACAVWWRRP